MIREIKDMINWSEAEIQKIKNYQDNVLDFGLTNEAKDILKTLVELQNKVEKFSEICDNEFKQALKK
jgi:hypothetical protein